MPRIIKWEDTKEKKPTQGPNNESGSVFVVAAFPSHPVPIKKDGFYGQSSERFIIYRAPGDIMYGYFICKQCILIFFIIAFNILCLYEVYTPVPSVNCSGHFYTYNSLHLTEVSHLIDHWTSGSLSNQTHPSSTMTIAMMLAALPLYKNNCKSYIINKSKF